MPTAPDPATLQAMFTGMVVVSLTALASLAATILQMVNSRRSQKREVTIDGGYVDKTEFEKFVESNRQEHANLFSKLGGVERGGQSRIDDSFQELSQAVARHGHESEQRAVELHNRLNPFGERIGALEKETELLNQRIVQMDAKLDRLIERRTP